MSVTAALDRLAQIVAEDKRHRAAVPVRLRKTETLARRHFLEGYSVIQRDQEPRWIRLTTHDGHFIAAQTDDLNWQARLS